MSSLSTHFTAFSSLLLPQKYQKVMGILDDLQEQVPLCHDLFVMLTTCKDQVTETILSTIYETIMTTGYDLEQQELTTDGSQVSDFVSMYAEIEQNAILQEIRKSLQDIKV